MEKLRALRQSKESEQSGLFIRMGSQLTRNMQQLTDEQLVTESSTLFFAGIEDLHRTLVGNELTSSRHRYHSIHDLYRTVAFTTLTCTIR